MVPKDWKEVKLGEIFDFRNGINADKSQYGQGVKFVNVMDVFGNHILTESKIIGRISISDKKLDDNRLEYGDVLFNRTSETFDEIAMSAVYLDNTDATFGGFVIRGRPLTNKLDPRYTVYAFQDSNFRKQVIKLGQGAIRANIGQKDLVKVKLLVPPVQEQQKIAKILSTWDKAISITERLIENSTQQKKALMQQLLTGKKRLVDDEGKRFAGEWELKKVSDFFDVSSSKRVLQEDWKDNGVPFYRTRELVSLAKNEPFRSSIYIADDYYEELINKYGMPDEGDFLVSGVGTLGIIYQVKENDRFYFKDGNVLWFKKEKEVSSDFFKYSFLSDYIQNQINTQASVTTVGTYTITNAKKTKFHCPPLKEQNKIATALTNADKEIELLEQQLADLQQEKKALMQVLLTGKKRVMVDG